MPFKVSFTDSGPDKRVSTTKSWRPADPNLLPITAKKIQHAWKPPILRLMNSFKSALLEFFVKLLKLLRILHDQVEVLYKLNQVPPPWLSLDSKFFELRHIL